jgi:hypothetical protein
VGRMPPADLAAGRQGRTEPLCLRRGEQREEAQDRGRGGFKSRSTAPRPLAPWSHDTTPEGMAPCLHATTPWLLSPRALTGFFPHHGGANVSSYGVSPCDAVLSTYGAKRLGAVLWVHSCNCFPQRSIR